MSSDPAVVRLRLSPSQISAIWPGLDRIVRSYGSYRSSHNWIYSYPFRLYPPPRGFDRGTFDADLMDQMVGLWKRLRPKAKTGGRTQMNAVEVRAAILAVRVNLDWWRYEKHRQRKNAARATRLIGVAPETLSRLQKRAHRTIQALERHMKRANRQLLALVARDAYTALMNVWRAHVRWIRLHIVYFRPRRPILKATKKRYQGILRELEEMARDALAQDGYVQPPVSEFRHVIRQFARSCRRGRQEPFNIPYMLKSRQDRFAKTHLAKFVLDRVRLQRLPER